MSKRKRGEEQDSEQEAKTAANFRLQRRIVDTFTQSTNELAKAFKTARGFERQKLGRRKKNAAANKDEQDMQRIDSEITALKTLDMTTCAQHYLQKSLLKIKAIATSPQLPSPLSQIAALSKDNAALNVNARLCNSNPVKEVFSRLCSMVKKEFGIEDEVVASVKKQRLRAKDYQDTRPAESGDASSEVSGDSGEPRQSLSKANPAVRNVSSSAHSDDDSDGELGLYAGRLAPSDDEESDLDIDSDIEDLEKQLEREGVARTKSKARRITYDPTADLSISEDENSSEHDEQPKRTAVPKKSAFIPSLTLGGYISGSGSDLEDDFDIAPKKNRRGQRARQQIWEKKFGKGAKHLQQEGRAAGWDPKRGAVGGSGRPAKTEPNPERFAKGANMEKLGKSRFPAPGAAPTAAATAPKKPRKDDTGPLHPSWEAAKRAKEKKVVPVAFLGKKISFD